MTLLKNHSLSLSPLLAILPALTVALSGCVTIVHDPEPSQHVWASFTMDPPGGILPAGGSVVVSFDASSTNGSSLTYAWDFGDGSRAQGLRTTHAYTRAGRFVVTLRVEPKEGRMDEGSKSVATAEIAFGMSLSFSGKVSRTSSKLSVPFDVGPHSRGIRGSISYDDPRTGGADLFLLFPNGSNSDPQRAYTSVEDRGGTIWVIVDLPFQIVVRGGDLGEGVWTAEASYDLMGPTSTGASGLNTQGAEASSQGIPAPPLPPQPPSLAPSSIGYAFPSPSEPYHPSPPATHPSGSDTPYPCGSYEDPSAPSPDAIRVPGEIQLVGEIVVYY